MHITGEPEGTPVKVGVAITGTLDCLDLALDFDILH